ncbi:BZ3500_MvSof-1268-A1-R1_Chr6-3g08733 [Microbotryum saponariae]|uniref:BZ3500_MvSof-1268-A1-R1_Chr6-3g08733 protein n=1 Tax=Microbotryum saponariae TaxID=289078 RepID=A0A2X0LJU2_9BASI|nr:BZ3500_MvSof-1268-A1-R1_Chr6-3g08733 [Microbotryum saponariae]SDA07334.1 BZ3501_MvSof-1269-A2-R1_Chr6-2g08436 [Microbotryum saponariae]
MHSLSCDQTAYGEEGLSIETGLVCYSAIHLQQSDNSALASLVVLSNVVVQELRLIKKACSSTHLIDGTMPFRTIDGRQHELSAHAEQRFASLRSVPRAGLQDAAGRTSTSRKCHRGYKELNKEGLFDAWSHARHQPKRRAPQATFDRPPRARKRPERVFGLLSDFRSM